MVFLVGSEDGNTTQYQHSKDTRVDHTEETCFLTENFHILHQELPYHKAHD